MALSLRSDLGTLMQAAVKEYNEITKDVHVPRDPSSMNAESMKDVNTYVSDHASNFKKFRHPGTALDNIRSGISKNLNIVQAMSNVLAGPATTAFPAAAPIFTAINFLVFTANRVKADFDKLMDFLDEVGACMNSISITEGYVHRGLPIPQLDEDFKNVFGAVLNLCGISTKYIQDGRFAGALLKGIFGNDRGLNAAYVRLQKSMVNLGRSIESGIFKGVVFLIVGLKDLQEKLNVGLATIEGMGQDIGAIKEGIESLDLHRQNDQREKVYKWLSAPDPLVNHEAARQKRQPTTGTWFTQSEQYASWKTNVDSFLWLHGILGCGKTILSSTIIEDVLQYCRLDPTLAVAYFYFDFSSPEKQEYEKMIRSLIAQLSAQSLRRPSALESLYSSKMDGGQNPTTGELLATLRTMVQEFDQTFVILDALDECGDREGLLLMIEKIANWKIGKLHILATSRTERVIEDALEPLITGQNSIAPAHVDADIESYLHEKLQSDSKLKLWPESVKMEIKKKLMADANGMFRLVVCQVDVLRKCRRLDKLQDALKSLPDTLYGTYDRILLNIDEEYSQDARKLLLWLAFSARPLQIEEVAEVVTVDMDSNPRFDPVKRFQTPQEVLEICSSLVTTAAETISDSDDKSISGEIRLAHFSVKEYLMSESIGNGLANMYSIQKIPAHISIAETCVEYLLQFGNPNSLTSQTFEEFPLARYAAQYWTFHASFDERSGQSTAMKIFEQIENILTWIRLYDPDEEGPKLDKAAEDLGSPLYYASMCGLVELVKLLFKAGVNVNAKGAYYTNALPAAAYGGHFQIVKLFLEKKADIDNLGAVRKEALLTAMYWGRKDVVQLLFDPGVDVNDSEFGSCGYMLETAAAWSNGQFVQMVLDAGPDINAVGGHYGTALRAAALQGNEGAVRLLLDHGANIHARGGKSGTPLQVARAFERHSIVQLLLDKGAGAGAEEEEEV